MRSSSNESFVLVATVEDVGQRLYNVLLFMVYAKRLVFIGIPEG